MINVISTSEARTMLPAFINSFKTSDNSFVLGRRDRPEAVLIKFSSDFNPSLDDITNINTYSSSFDFLKNEPELYSVSDVLK